MHSRRTFIASVAGWAGLAAPSLRAQTPAQTQTQPAAFPQKMIRIVPFGTGGGPIDTLARLYADKLRTRWSQTLIVDAKPGASGILAADFVAKAPADGHTVMFTLPLTHVNNAILHAKLPYDPVKDFAPLSMLGTGGPMLVARADAPYRSLTEFVAFAKASKQPLTYGTWGNGSTAHLFSELLRRQTGAPLLHVPYKAEAAVHSDLYGNVLDFAWANPATAKSQAARMKVLAVAGTRRLSVLPDVPTFTEQGFAGFDIDSWIGVYAPARTPPAVVDAWVGALRDTTRLPDVAARLVAMGFEPLGNTPDEFMRRYEADYPRMAELIKAAGVTAE